MPAGKLNLTVEQGATFRKSMIWKDNTGTPIDLTGFTARMLIVAHGSAVIELTTENGRITLNEQPGKIALLISAADTDSMPLATGAYDLKLVSGQEEVRLVEGSVYVSSSITPRAS